MVDHVGDLRDFLLTRQMPENRVRAENNIMSQDENQLDQQAKDELKTEILNDLRREALKKEILNELRPVNWKSQLSKATRHPLFLLTLGFILTGGVGALLTSYSENKKWDYQQRRLAQIRTVEQRVKQKNDTRDEVKRVVDKSLTTSERVLPVLFSEDAVTSSSAEASARTTEWQTAQKQKLENYNQLRVTLQADFKNPEVSRAFEEIANNDAEINLNLTEALKLAKDRGKTNQGLGELSRVLEKSWRMLEDARKQLSRLLVLMESEIQSDEATAFQAT